MRQAVLLALTISLFITAGCSGSAGDEEKFEKHRSEFLLQESHEITAEIESLVAQKYCKYTLLYTKDAQSETVRVLEPELIAEVSAQMDDKGESMSFNGAILETGGALNEKVSPMTALPLMMDFIEKGHLEGISREQQGETQYLAAELELSDGLRMTLLTEAVSGALVGGAIAENGIVVIKILVTDTH